MVSLLQEFEEDGAINHTICGKAVIPRSKLDKSSYLYVCDDYPQLMSMNVIPRLIMDDAAWSSSVFTSGLNICTNITRES